MDKLKLYKPIEKRYFNNNDWKNIKIEECNDKLISIQQLSNKRITYKAKYFEKGIPGSINQCLIREQLGELLIKASYKLPLGYKFLIYDAWRPIEVQEYLFNQYIKELENDSNKTKQEIIKNAQNYVSIPSSDINKPSPHFTGGAIDITITKDDEDILNMEQEFDNFNIRAHTRYFEGKIEHGIELSDKERYYCYERRLLYNCLISVGLTNFPNEWWHFDFGNQFWGYLSNTNAIYGLIQNK